MKKFISMVMAAAMVVSLVPATAFAASCTLKVNDAAKYTKMQADDATKSTDLTLGGAQLQIKLTDADTKLNVTGEEMEVKLTFDGAKLVTKVADAKITRGLFDVSVYDKDQATLVDVKEAYTMKDGDKKVTITFIEEFDLADDDIVYINIYNTEAAKLGFTSKKAGHEATVAVSGDLGSADAKMVGTVVTAGITVDVDDVVAVAEDDTALLEEITIETTTKTFEKVLDFKYDLNNGKYVAGDEYAKIVLTVSHGFEIAKATDVKTSIAADLDEDNSDDDEIILYVHKSDVTGKDEMTVNGIVIDSENAKVGAECTIKVTSPSLDAQEVVVAKVVDQALTIEVDEDEDVPVYWSGVSVGDEGLTCSEDHKSVLITLSETVIGAYDDRDEVELTLPEGVYVVDVTNANGGETFFKNSVEKSFREAYKEGDEKSFVFEKGTILESVGAKEEMEFEFKLVLVADPAFNGPVELGMKVDGEDAGSVVIAEFKPAFFVEAAQNDLIIDYRNTEVPTSIVITEAEAGLWSDKLSFKLSVEEIAFEGDPEVTVNEDASDMEIDATVSKDDVIEIEIDEESDDEAGVITISGIELFMSRNLPAGAYDLEMEVDDTTAWAFYGEELYTATKTDLKSKYGKTYATVADFNGYVTKGEEDVPAMLAKEGFVNIITAGRDKDDASFTKKVVVPVGEAYLIAGEETVALDVPAYINANGYTMLPVRAVAVALGINTNNVIWSQAAKQVTILYGQRIITMTVGQSVIYVNGSAIPASAAVEVVDGRAFLGLRDLANALGVTDIAYDAATKTATLN